MTIKFEDYDEELANRVVMCYRLRSHRWYRTDEGKSRYPPSLLVKRVQQIQQPIHGGLLFTNKGLGLSRIQQLQGIKLFVNQWYATRYGLSRKSMASGVSSQRGSSSALRQRV